MRTKRRVTLLGPQRLKPTLIEAVRSLEITGTIATVTAGWQEREDEDQELHDHLEKRSVNLRLYQRTEAVLRADPEFAAAHRNRQDQLRQMQDLYDLRLGHALAACYALLQRQIDHDLVAREFLAALEAVRMLDAEHLAAVREVHVAFDQEWRPADRVEIRRARAEVADIVDGTSAVAVAGGHVALLLNRLELFDLANLVGDRPVLAWSAGAMAVSEKVVLFHDSPPQGPGNAEVLEAGLCLCPGVVPLPHARRRLRLDDRLRVSVFARRFAPAVCFAMDEGARVDWNGKSWSAAPGTMRLGLEGDLEVPRETE